MGLSRQEYWGGLPFPSPGDLPHPGIKPRSPTLQADTLPSELCLTLETPWTIACQAPLSMGFSRQEYWGGLPFPSPGDLPDPGIKPWSPALQADSLPLGKPNPSLTVSSQRYSYHSSQKMREKTNNPVCVCMHAYLCVYMCMCVYISLYQFLST